MTQAVLVRSGSRHYAIPSSMVAQVRELKPDAIASIRTEGAASWLGDSYPWRYLPCLLGHPEATPEPARRHWLMLLRAGEQHVALEVDDLIGNQEVVVKNIGPQLARVAGIAGATVQGDGEIVLILNPVALAGREATATIVAATGLPVAPAASETVTSHAAVVMIVDDSLTVRKITSRLLAREGYPRGDGQGWRRRARATTRHQARCHAGGHRNAAHGWFRPDAQCPRRRATGQGGRSS